MWDMGEESERAMVFGGVFFLLLSFAFFLLPFPSYFFLFEGERELRRYFSL